MNSKYTLEIPQTLTEAEARIVMEVLEEMIDCLCRHLHELDRHAGPDAPSWDAPDWLERTGSSDED